MHADELVRNHTPISDQVSPEQLRVILRELEHTLEHQSEGAIVEFGCYIGTTSLFIRRLLDSRGESSQHPFHVYDSFEGLPAKTVQDTSQAGEQFQAGELRVSKKQFLHEFFKAGLEAPIVHKGWFGNLQPAEVPDPILFAFLDGDFYESIRDSLRLVLPRMLPGGVIVIDDYAREALPGAARAVHDYLPPEYRLGLRTEQNLGIIHLHETASDNHR